tara:strand:- start:66 stop:662 length:597 start_codon:yes stop_codon:yes gene_type:complete
MNKKIYLQLILIFLLVVLSLFFYKEYFDTNTDVKKITKKIEKDKKIKQDNNEATSNIIENLKYVSKDLLGNTYIIEADSAELIEKEKNNIVLMKVTAKIIQKNEDIIYIYSEIANYNKINSNTIFEKNVKVNYGKQKLEANLMRLNFSENMIEIEESVNYINESLRIRADKAEINLLSKKLNISMKNDKDKIFINGQY